MKVEVTLWDTEGQEIDADVVDVGDAYDDEIPEKEQEGSQKIHDVMERYLLFPGCHITITVPKEMGKRVTGPAAESQMFGSAMGVLTVAREGDGWIVLEDGRRVGGTLLVPFASQEAAQRYVERELADEAETMASGDVARSATARAIRDLDAEVWARFEKVEKEFADKDEATKEAAHRAAGTFIVMVQICMARLEAEGKIYRTSETRHGQPVFAATKHYQH